MKKKNDLTKKLIEPAIKGMCNLTMNMVERQACLWYTYQPKEPEKMKSISVKGLF